MSKSTKKKQSKSEIEKELERLEILQKASENKDRVNLIDMQGEFKSVDERSQLIVSDTDDPDKKYSLYYKEIEKMLRMVINPRMADKSTKEAFKILREEKNILLTRGKRKSKRGIRGRDARMGYAKDMEIAAEIIADVILGGSGPLELYIALRDKNIELGYYNDLASGKMSKELRDDGTIYETFRAIKSKKSGDTN